MKVIDELWFQHIDAVVGIIIAEDEITKNRRAYLGVVGGRNQEADKQSILRHGQKFSMDTIERIKQGLTKAKSVKEG